jgi:hypothetical protein
MMTAIPVTVANFVRAESDMYFNRMASIDGGFGKYHHHHRELMSVARQPVIRGNRDTIYSPSVFDLDAGPVTVTMPDPGARFMTLLVIDQDHYLHGVFYGAGEHTFSREQIGTRYVALPIRTLVNPNDPADVRQVHALQDAVTVRQKSAGRFELPVWDQASQKRLREALLVLGELQCEQHHGTEGNRRVHRRAIWRLRRPRAQLHSDHAWMELSGAAVSPTCRDPRRDVDIPQRAAGGDRYSARSADIRVTRTSTGGQRGAIVTPGGAGIESGTKKSATGSTEGSTRYLWKSRSPSSYKRVSSIRKRPVKSRDGLVMTA